MDQKLEILNYINDERLDLEELAGTEATLYETIAALPAGDLSTVIDSSTVRRTGAQSDKLPMICHFNNGFFRSHHTQEKFLTG